MRPPKAATDEAAPALRRWPRLPRAFQRMLSTLALLAGGFALLLLLLWLGQERLIFLPTPLRAEHRFNFGPDVQETWVEVPGARLHALHLRLPKPDGVVFYLHGNAGNLQSWFSHADIYRSANFDLFMLDYRGYGKSSGRVQSQEQLLDDVRAAWAQVGPRYTGLRRVIAGRSLGTALAAMLAAEVQPELTLLISPYESMRALASEFYPWVPGALLRYPLRTDEALARVRGPVWLVHGDRDEIIGVGHSQRLLRHSPQARLLKVPGAGHNDLQEFEAYSRGVREALDSLR